MDKLKETLSKTTVAGRACTLGVAAVFAAGLFVWPTLYRYDHMNIQGTVLPVRIHRVSGKTAILSVKGIWITRPNQPNQAEAATAPLPENELKKLQCDPEFIDNRLYCSIYNGTSNRVNEILVHVQVTETRWGLNVIEIDRDYRLKNTYFTDPLTQGIFSDNVGFSPKNGQEWFCRIKEARGLKTNDDE